MRRHSTTTGKRHTGMWLLLAGSVLTLTSSPKSLPGENVFVPPQVTYELLPDSLLGHVAECNEQNVGVELTVPLTGTFTMVLNQGNDGLFGVIDRVRFESTTGPSYVISGTGGYFLGLETEGLDLVLTINDLPPLWLTSELHLAGDFCDFPSICIGLFQMVRADDCFALFLSAVPIPEEAIQFFRRGDANGDGSVNISDAIYSLNYLFRGGIEPGCRDAADTDDDGRLDLSDAVTLLRSLFGRTGPLTIPSHLCGLDPTEDTLRCSGHPPCMAGKNEAA